MSANRSKVRKAVFPVAGLGSRFLPVTKASPKEMLPIVDKPLIQYAVEEAVAAGIEVLIFVNSKNKRSIEDYFDDARDLHEDLRRKNKPELLDKITDIIPAGVSCVNLRQPHASGLGDAVLCAEAVIHDEPFAVLLADDLLRAEGPGCLERLLRVYDDKGGAVLALMEVASEATDRYGIIAGTRAGDDLWRIERLVEKPPPAEAPSRMGVIGRYVLQPDIFEHLKSVPSGAGGELQLTDAIASQIGSQPVHGLVYRGRRHDCGDKLGYLCANVEYALERPDLGDDFRAYLANLNVRKGRA